MRRLWRRSAIGFLALLLLAIVLGGAVMIAGNTNPGRAMIERLTYRLTAGYVKLTGLGGGFPTQLTLEQLQLIDAHGVWLTADHISLRWSPLKLLEKRIQVDKLQLARLQVDRAPFSDSHGGTATVPDIEVGQFSADSVVLGTALVGQAVTLSLHGNLRLRSLEDAKADIVARRLDGDGDYTLHVQFDPKKMDASLAIHEPASGPLENLLSLPGLGALSATATLVGPRDAERVDVALTAGDLRAQVKGSLDLRKRSAQLEYSLTSPAMAPRPDLSWSRASLQGNWQGSWSEPVADGHLSIEGLQIAGTTRVARLTADLIGNAGKIAVRASADGLEIPGPQPRFFANSPWKIDASLQLNQAELPLEATALHPLATLRAHGAARPDKAGALRATVELKLPNLAPYAVFTAQDIDGSASINARLEHRPSADALALDGTIDLTGGSAPWLKFAGPRIALQLSSRLSPSDIKIDNVRIATLAATAVANASATRVIPGASPPKGVAANPLAGIVKDLQARWQIEISDLSALSSDATGTLKMTGRASGSPNSIAADTEIDSTLSVRGSPSGTVIASIQARGLPTAPSATLRAHGMLDGAPLTVDTAIERSGGDTYRLIVRQAAWKSARMDGDLTADTALTRTRGELHLQIDQLGDLERLLGIRLAGSLVGAVDFVPARGKTEARLQLDGHDLAFGQFAGTLHLEALGVADALGLKMTVDLPKLYGTPASVAAAATLDLDKEELRLASASLGYRGETFRLLAPAQLSFAKGLAIDDLKIGAQEAVFELKGELAPALDLRASLDEVKPSLVNMFAPNLLSDGTISAQATLRGSAASPTGRIRFDATGIRFADDAATGLPPVDLHARAQLADDAATIDAKLNAGAGSQMTATGKTPLNPNGALDMKIGGKLDASLANPFLEARGMRAGGELTVDATVTGNSAAPQVGGGITLAQGSLRDYGRGVNLSDIAAEVVGNEGTLQIKSFKAMAGSGSIGMSGSFGVLQPGLPVDLTITAKNAQPIASSILTANLDTDLHVTGKAADRIDVAGSVHVNRATIGIPNSLPPDVAVLDVRRRGQTPEATGKQLIIGIDVTVQAPQQILVQGRGLDAELGGEIHLVGTSDELVASGGFDLLRGSFTLAGNKLSFTDGRVGFDGTGLRKKIDPTLDFTAQSTLADNTTVTLKIGGLADAPKFNFSSSPALQPDEIMARLLFGQPSQQLSAFQLAQTAAALATLSGVGGSGSNPLVRLQKSLGLDRLSVGGNTTTTATGATENSGAAIEAGRYISKRVYVEGRQTTTGTSQVQVDVDLTKHLQLQTRLGNGTANTQGTTPENDPGSSVGLKYQFEY